MSEDTMSLQTHNYLLLKYFFSLGEEKSYWSTHKI